MKLFFFCISAFLPLYVYKKTGWDTGFAIGSAEILSGGKQ
jgi:hypothetical protein